MAAAVGGLAEAQGHQVAGPHHEGADLLVLEALTPEEVEPHRGGAPILVVVARRLRDAEHRAFLAAGAGRVCDAESSLLDVAFALGELLFPTLRLHRRYGRQFGGVATCFGPSDGTQEAAEGALVAISQAGAYLVTSALLAEGTPLSMAIGINGRTVELKGRVTFVADSEGERGFGVEFALDAPDVAPRLSDLVGDEARRTPIDPPLARASL